MRELRRKPRRCRTRYLWWGYVKNCIRVYPDRRRQMESVDAQAVSNGMESDLYTGPPRPTERQAMLNIDREGQWSREYNGVRMAVNETRTLPDGPARLLLVDSVLWKGTHTIQGAALLCHVSERTAAQWHGDFIRLTAVHMGLLDRKDF